MNVRVFLESGWHLVPQETVASVRQHWPGLSGAEVRLQKIFLGGTRGDTGPMPKTLSLSLHLQTDLQERLCQSL